MMSFQLLTFVRSQIERVQQSRKLAVGIVFMCLLADGILMTMVVPIIPDYLYQIQVKSEQAEKLRLCSKIRPSNSTNNETLVNSTEPHDADGYILPQDIINENSKVGWLFSSKAILQLVANPAVGFLTYRIGYTIPLFFGSFVLFLSSLVFAFGESYILLFLARAVHGIGTSCYQVAGLGMLASIYCDDKLRSKAMGIALGGQGFGIVIGYPLGGSLYAFVGKMTPFLITAVIVALTGALVLLIHRPEVTHGVSCKQFQDSVGTPLHVILRDPYIILVSYLLMMPEMSIAILEPTLPIWLADNLHVQKWQVGLVFLPDCIGQLIASNLFGIASYKIGRWVCGLSSLVTIGICLIMLPFATKIVHLILPHFGVGFSIGVMNATMLPLLALLVDQRHQAEYGIVYAIGQVACSLGFFIGPSIGGQLVKSMGFPWLIRGMGIFCLVTCPVCYLLRELPCKEENQSILNEDDSHATYTDENQLGFKYKKFTNSDVTSP